MTAFAWGDALPDLPGTRVHLRPLRAGDEPNLFAIYSDPEVMRYRDGVRMETLADAGRYIADVHEYFNRRELFEWAIVEAATDRLIGTATLVHIEPRHRRAEIGFAIGRTHWGKGLAREGVARLLTFSFDELALHRIEADVDPRNEPSLRLMTRLGFTREGLLRQRYRDDEGMQDAVTWGLLRHEWRGWPLL